MHIDKRDECRRFCAFRKVWVREDDEICALNNITWVIFCRPVLIYIILISYSKRELTLTLLFRYNIYIYIVATVDGGLPAFHLWNLHADQRLVGHCQTQGDGRYYIF